MQDAGAPTVKSVTMRAHRRHDEVVPIGRVRCWLRPVGVASHQNRKQSMTLTRNPLGALTAGLLIAAPILLATPAMAATDDTRW